MWPPVTSDAAISKMTAFIISPPSCVFQCDPRPLSLRTFWFEPLMPVSRIITSHSGHNSLHFEQKTHSYYTFLLHLPFFYFETSILYSFRTDCVSGRLG